MSEVNILLAQNEAFKIVTVVFNTSNKPYTYKTMLPVKVGDMVVVEAPSGFTVVEVIDVVPGVESELSHKYNLKWLVQVVDTTHYLDMVDIERAAQKQLNSLAARRRHKELIDDMRATIGEDTVNELQKIVRL